MTPLCRLLKSRTDALAQKQETINRLLKKQTGKKGGKRGTGGTATPANEDDSKATGTSTPALLPAAVRPPPIPIGYRHISSTKSGAFGYVLAVPTGKEAAFVTKVATGYPGPRPPLKTKRLVA